jgi:hypothetical protein
VTRPKELRVIIDHFDKYPRHNSETCWFWLILASCWNAKLQRTFNYRRNS